MWSVGGILDNKETDKNEYYKILGCDENSTDEQIAAEYKILALKCHPDKNCGNENSIAEFQALQEARDILTDPEKRKQYDNWRRAEIAMPFQQWQAMSNRFKPTMHWIQPKTQIMLEEGQEDRATAPSSQDQKDKSEPCINTGPNSGQTNCSASDIRTGTGPQKYQGWEPDKRSGSGVYKKFRDYEI